MRPAPGLAPRVTLAVEEGAVVPQGAAVARLQDAPDMCLRRADARAGRADHLLQGTGCRRSCCSANRAEMSIRHDCRGRDRGRSAPADADGRRLAMAGAPALRRDAGAGGTARSHLRHGDRHHALRPRPARRAGGAGRRVRARASRAGKLTDGPVFVCQRPGPRLFDRAPGAGRIRVVDSGPRHPQGAPGSAGPCAVSGQHRAAGVGHPCRGRGASRRLDRHRHAAHDAPGQRRRVGAARGAAAAHPARRRSARADPADRASRARMCCCPARRSTGRPAHWLAPRHRQVTVLPRQPTGKPPHWLVAALTRSADAEAGHPERGA